VAGILAVLGLTAAFVWGAVGTITALDRVDDFDRVTIPGSMTVFVTDPGTKVVYYESPAELARYADPTATSRNATRWTPRPTPPSRWAMPPTPRPGSSSGCR
jgi:hypothetical protein